MTRQIALLRGVNLGKRKVVMSELRALCEEAGFTQVRTLLASGNLALVAKLRGARLETKLEALIRDGMGLETDVFVRSADELEAVMAANPFKTFARTHPSFLMINFMRGPASEAELDALRASARGEEWAQGECCLYIRYPSGQGQSRLKLPRFGTARNWNTVTKLAAMARGE
jgi:uncharacterized protein (DUF1697 family)